jgi:hypothetical protein
MFEVEGKDGVILTLGDGWYNPNLGTRGGVIPGFYAKTKYSSYA